ncbi:hypothetical protein AMTRI_Chr08g164490 [Amborella trichopoda]
MADVGVLHQNELSGALLVGVLHWNELSGALTGLTHVWRFQQVHFRNLWLTYLTYVFVADMCHN